MFATEKELARLTGSSRKSGQVGWLQEHGYAFDLDRFQRPIVLVAEIEAHLLSKPRKEQNGLTLNLDEVA